MDACLAAPVPVSFTNSGLALWTARRLAYNEPMRTLVLVAVLVFDAVSSVRANEGAATAGMEPVARVTVDLAARAFDRTLPFDVPFAVIGTVPDGTIQVAVQFTEVPESGLPQSPVWTPSVPAVWEPQVSSLSGSQMFLVFFRNTLDARHTYRFRFTILRQRSEEPAQIAVDGKTTGNSYVSADAGMLYAPDIETAALYIGSNIYFRPVNKRAPLSEKGSFLRRAAVTIGFTVTSIADEDQQTRSDMFGHQSLVLGAGVRLTQAIRAGGGVLIFKENNPNPLITKSSTVTTPYVSFSFDLDVGGMFQRFGW